MAFLQEWELLAQTIERHREGVESLPITPTHSREQIQRRLAACFPFSSARPLAEVIEDVADMLAGGTVHLANPGYFGLFNSDIHPASLAADALVAGFNPQLAAYSHAPAAVEIERHVLDVFAQELGWSDAGRIFTTGGAEANHTAIIAALVDRLPDFAEEGLQGRRPTLYVSEESHHSLAKVAVACGLGRSAVRRVPVDATLAMRLDRLQAALENDRREGRQPTLIVGTAATTSAGAIDPLAELAELASQQGLWFHVDAAWGGAALLVPHLKPHLRGIERADSVTIDAHKWLSNPMGTGLVLLREARCLRAAFGTQTGYMPAATADLDPYTNGMPWSRRLNGLKLFMTLAALGRDGFAASIARHAEMTDLIAKRLGEIGWRVQHHSPLAVVTFLPPDERDLDALVAAVQARGRVWISKAVLSHGGAVLRACVTNYRSGPEHVELLIEELLAVTA
jgi:glutamate/tyrosine decarboxylase-like PLP-dependent enzyme